jgi:chromosome segregation ATPase
MKRSIPHWNDALERDYTDYENRSSTLEDLVDYCNAHEKQSEATLKFKDEINAAVDFLNGFIKQGCLTLKAFKEDMANAIATLTGSVTNNYRFITALQDRLNTQAKKIEKLEEKLTNNWAVIQARDKVIQKIDGRTILLHNALNTTQGRLRDVAKELRFANTEICTHENAERNKLEERIAKLESGDTGWAQSHDM